MGIITKSNKEGREVTTSMPTVLDPEISLKELIEALGEEMSKSKIQSQLTVDFRSRVRGQLEAKDDNEEYRYSEDEIATADYTDWVPETRTRKSAEEKAADILGKLSPDQIKAALAKAGQ